MKKGDLVMWNKTWASDPNVGIVLKIKQIEGWREPQATIMWAGFLKTILSKKALEVVS